MRDATPRLRLPKGNAHGSGTWSGETVLQAVTAVEAFRIEAGDETRKVPRLRLQRRVAHGRGAWSGTVQACACSCCRVFWALNAQDFSPYAGAAIPTQSSRHSAPERGTCMSDEKPQAHWPMFPCPACVLKLPPESPTQPLLCRGQATAEDLKGPARAPGAPTERGDWMTQLPEERRPNQGPPSQKSQVASAPPLPRRLQSRAAGMESSCLRFDYAQGVLWQVATSSRLKLGEEEGSLACCHRLGSYSEAASPWSSSASQAPSASRASASASAPPS